MYLAIGIVRFFLDFGHDTPNSWLLVILGVLSLAALLIGVSLKSYREGFRTFKPMMIAGILFLPGFALLFVLLLGYGWPFDNIIIRRLSIPVHIPMSIAAGVVCFYWVRVSLWRKAFALLIAAYYIGYAFPVTSKHLYSEKYLAGMEFDAAEEFLRHETRNTCCSSLTVPDSLSCLAKMPWQRCLRIRQEAIKFYINQPNSPPIYYFQRLRYNPLDHEFELTSKVHLEMRSLSGLG